MAYTGNPSRVTLKRDIKSLITDGAKKGSISVHTSEGQFGTELPATKTAVHFSGNNFLPFALMPAPLQRWTIKRDVSCCLS